MKFQIEKKEEIRFWASQGACGSENVFSGEKFLVGKIIKNDLALDPKEIISIIIF